jgi:hypothetical protein
VILLRNFGRERHTGQTKETVALRWRPSTIKKMKSHRPPLRRCATTAGRG